MWWSYRTFIAGHCQICGSLLCHQQLRIVVYALFRKGFWNRATCSRKQDEVGIQCLGERVTTTTTTPKPKSTTTLPPQISTGGKGSELFIRLPEVLAPLVRLSCSLYSEVISRIAWASHGSVILSFPE